MENDWDRNKWQGRTRKQIDDTAKIISWIIVAATLVIGIVAIYYVLTERI